MSSDLEASSSSTSHRECRSSLAHLEPPTKLESVGIGTTMSANLNDLGLTEVAGIYGGSIINNGSEGKYSKMDPEQNLSPNCQTSVIQTSQNQCYIVLQLNLPSNTEATQMNDNQRRNRISLSEAQARYRKTIIIRKRLLKTLIFIILLT